MFRYEADFLFDLIDDDESDAIDISEFFSLITVCKVKLETHVLKNGIVQKRMSQQHSSLWDRFKFKIEDHMDDPGKWPHLSDENSEAFRKMRKSWYRRVSNARADVEVVIKSRTFRDFVAIVITMNTLIYVAIAEFHWLSFTHRWRLLRITQQLFYLIYVLELLLKCFALGLPRFFSRGAMHARMHVRMHACTHGWAYTHAHTNGHSKQHVRHDRCAAWGAS